MEQSKNTSSDPKLKIKMLPYLYAATVLAAVSNLPSASAQEVNARLSGLEALNRKDYESAEKFFNANLDNLKKTGVNDERLGAAFVDISSLYSQQEKYSDAELALRRAIVIFEAHEPDRGANTMMASNLLEQVYEKEGKNNDAALILSDLKEFYEKTYPGEPLLIGILKRYGQLLQKIPGREKEATAALDQAAEIEKNRLPSAEQAEKLASGDLAKQKNDLDKAHTDYQSALDAAEKQFGKEDVRYSDALYKMSNLYLAQKKYKDAEPLARQVVSIREKKLGATHQSVADGLRLLASILKEEGKLNEALDVVDRANKIMVLRLKTVDPAAAARLENINKNLAALRASLSSDDQVEKPANKDEAVRQNMSAVQIIVESYALQHGGHFPAAVNQSLSPYFSGSGRWGRAPINPFTLKAEWPVTGHLVSVAAVRKSSPGPLAAGKIEYTCLHKGTGYAIRGGGAKGVALTDKASHFTLVLSNE